MTKDMRVKLESGVRGSRGVDGCVDFRRKSTFLRFYGVRGIEYFIGEGIIRAGAGVDSNLRVRFKTWDACHPAPFYNYVGDRLKNLMVSFSAIYADVISLYVFQHKHKGGKDDNSWY